MDSIVFTCDEAMLHPAVGDDPQENQLNRERCTKAYETQKEKAAKNLAGQMCYTGDWFPEPRPLENRYGSGIVDHVAALIDPNAGIDGVSRDMLPDLDPLPPVRILVFPDNYGYCKGIMNYAAYPVDRKKVVTKDPATIGPNETKKLLAEKWDLILFGAGMDAPEECDASELIAHQNTVTKLFFQIVQVLANNPEYARAVAVLSVDTFSINREIHEECGIGILAGASLFGMTNTARQEIPEVVFHYIETDWSLPEHMMKNLSSEVFRGPSFGMDTVRILTEGRFVQRRLPSTPYEAAAKKKFEAPESGSVIGISGGNGALAMIMAGFLLDKAKEQGKAGFTIKFLSRSAKVSDPTNLKAWEAVQAKAAKLGIHVEMAKCDVSSKEAVRKFVEDHSPNLAGFIHSAGVLQDSLIVNQTWQKFEQVFAPKSHAAIYLHEALQQYDNPKFNLLWLFSSTSAWGNPGQINYSGSNTVLDALARHRNALGLPAMAVQWGAWGEVGMASTLDEASKRRFDKGPQPMFSNKEGVQGLDAALRTGLPVLAVLKLNAVVGMNMLAKETSVSQALMRNLESNLFPLPFTEDPEKHPNDYIRSITGGTARMSLHGCHFYRAACGITDEDN